jgi:hypothetical protein
MEKARSSFPWIARYCVRTLQLVPTLPGPVAVKWALSGYPYCGDAEPEEAAEKFVKTWYAKEKIRSTETLRRFFREQEQAPDR